MTETYRSDYNASDKAVFLTITRNDGVYKFNIPINQFVDHPSGPYEACGANQMRTHINKAAIESVRKCIVRNLPAEFKELRIIFIALLKEITVTGVCKNWKSAVDKVNGELWMDFYAHKMIFPANELLEIVSNITQYKSIEPKELRKRAEAIYQYRRKKYANEQQ